MKKFAILSIIAIIGISVIGASQSFAQEETKDIPNWIRFVAGHWVTEEVSDTEFLQALGYLIDKNILVVEESDNTLSESITDPFRNNLDAITEVTELRTQRDNDDRKIREMQERIVELEQQVKDVNTNSDVNIAQYQKQNDEHLDNIYTLQKQLYDSPKVTDIEKLNSQIAQLEATSITLQKRVDEMQELWGIVEGGNIGGKVQFVEHMKNYIDTLEKANTELNLKIKEFETQQ